VEPIHVSFGPSGICNRAVASNEEGKEEEDVARGRRTFCKQVSWSIIWSQGLLRGLRPGMLVKKVRIGKQGDALSSYRCNGFVQHYL